MAVKASIQITISKVIDVYAVYRYYKLQSSTLAKPSKPTANPPSGWSDTEPAYVSGSTNTLYFVDCNVYSDKTFSFSEVSKSSSYEAAKDAWNKAQNAQDTADSAKDFTDKVKKQYGYQYKYDITLKGDVNKYYPVIILSGNQNVMREIMVSRTHTEKCPTDWNGHPTFKGIALLLKLKCNFGGWGGITYSWWIHDLEEQYGNVFASAENCMSNMGFAIFLRGGGDTGAIYHLYSDQALETTLYEGSGPKAYYNSDRIAWLGGTSDNPTYSWNAPAPRTLTDAIKKQIASKKYIQMATDAISNVDVEYYLSTSATSLSGGSWSTTAPTWVNGKYMWSRTVTIDGAGNKTYSPSQNGVCIAGAKGDTGTAGKGVKSIVEQYYKSTSATSLSGGSWSTTYPGWENGKYIWTRSVITYTDNTSTTTTAVCVTGAKGSTGATGKGVKSSAVTYQASTSGTTIPTGTWQTTIPSVSAGSFLWTKTTITYTDNTSTTSYSVGKMGNTGSAGKDAITISATAPTSPKINQLWQTASGKPIKRWDGSKWVLYYVSVENLDVDTLSAITANLGTVTAGVIKAKASDGSSMIIDLDDGSVEVIKSDNNERLSLKNGSVTLQRNAIGSNHNMEVSIGVGGIKVTDKDTGDFSEIEFLGTALNIVESTQTKNPDTDIFNIYSRLRMVPISGTKVTTITKGQNYVKLFTAYEVKELLDLKGLAVDKGDADHVVISVANGDAKAFNARVFGAEYWSDSAEWFVYFNASATITQLVRINYMITRIDR